MEPFLFERDYRSVPLDAEAEAEEEVSSLLVEGGFFSTAERLLLEKPYILNPKRKKDFDRLLAICDDYALMCRGCVQGKIDYCKYEAKIILSGIDCYDFSMKETRDLLCQVALRSTLYTFGKDKEGGICMTIVIDCFEPILKKKEMEKIRRTAYNSMDTSILNRIKELILGQGS